MSQSIENNNRTQHAATAEPLPGMSPWSVFLLASISILLLLILGTYAFDWTWTGFRNNTLWDWLQLLVLPVVLTIVTAWFSTNKRWNGVWTWLIGLALVALVICAFGGYFLNWTWTGFHNNTLWDWLKLLVLPSVLTAVTVWFSTHMNELSGMQQAAGAFRQSTGMRMPANRSNRFPDSGDVEYNDSTVLIRQASPLKHIPRYGAENPENPVDNEPEI